MTEQTKSLIRHTLTAIGVLMTVLGLSSAAGFINITIANLDTMWQSILALVGVYTTYKGYFVGRTSSNQTPTTP